MVKLFDNSNAQAVKMSAESELLVCMCEPSCEGHISLEDLQKLYPGLKISLRIGNGN